jgi:hypothetical protein
MRFEPLGARHLHLSGRWKLTLVSFHFVALNNYKIFIGNPGRGVCALAACGRYPVGSEAAKPQRQYDALEIIVDKRFSSKVCF